MNYCACLGNCQLNLQAYSGEEEYLLHNFIQHYPDLVNCLPKIEPEIDVLIKKVNPTDVENRQIRSSIDQIIKKNEQQIDCNVFLYRDDHTVITKLFCYALEQATIWHLERDSISLHSAAVGINDHNGFLFLGDSGNGKSTISQFCNDANFAVLGDDANFVIANPIGGYSLHFSPTVNQRPYPYSRKAPALKAIFLLVQDTSDYLIKLPPHAIAARLYRSFQELYTNHGIPKDYQRTAFHICCNIARQIPGYELHFTKSNQFLNTIKAEFHDAF